MTGTYHLSNFMYLASSFILSMCFFLHSAWLLHPPISEKKHTASSEPGATFDINTCENLQSKLYLQLPKK
jgi:hypothetical protein